jgi:hypothetical protein
MQLKKFFSANNRKYLIAEITAYVAAPAVSAFAAVCADTLTDSDSLISIISTAGGTIGFFGGQMAAFSILNLNQYRRGCRNLNKDMMSIFEANIHGTWATYLFRIPLQIILQKLGISPLLAAPITQTVAGQVGTIVRIYTNYKNKILASDSAEYISTYQTSQPRTAFGRGQSRTELVRGQQKQGGELSR